jgi:hypothetical protein
MFEYQKYYSTGPVSLRRLRQHVPHRPSALCKEQEKIRDPPSPIASRVQSLARTRSLVRASDAASRENLRPVV